MPRWQPACQLLLYHDTGRVTAWETSGCSNLHHLSQLLQFTQTSLRFNSAIENSLRAEIFFPVVPLPFSNFTGVTLITSKTSTSEPPCLILQVLDFLPFQTNSSAILTPNLCGSWYITRYTFFFLFSSQFTGQINCASASPRLSEISFTDRYGKFQHSGKHQLFR